jgi:hypothetical protein
LGRRVSPTFTNSDKWNIRDLYPWGGDSELDTI